MRILGTCLVTLSLLTGDTSNTVGATAEAPSPAVLVEAVFDELETAGYLLPFSNSNGSIIYLDKLDILEVVFGCTSFPCRIAKNVGGDLKVFAFAAWAAQRRPETRFHIEGPCESACALFADHARTQVCLGPKAQIGFHKWQRLRLARVGDEIKFVPERYDPTHSSDVDQLVRKSLGRYPLKVAHLHRHDALKVWQPCEFVPPLPRPDPRKLRKPVGEPLQLVRH